MLVLQQVFSGLKGTLSWQANSKSTWTQTSSALVTGSKVASDHSITVAGVTDRYGTDQPEAQVDSHHQCRSIDT